MDPEFGSWLRSAPMAQAGQEAAPNWDGVDFSSRCKGTATWQTAEPSCTPPAPGSIAFT